MRWRVTAARLHGDAVVPGDKSIANRALMMAALASGRTAIRNLPAGEDVRATIESLRRLAVEIELSDSTATVSSAGQLSVPNDPIYAANSGTTMRLLAGILSGQSFRSRLEGDASLSRRPMGRIIDPLTKMGALIDSDGGRAPLDIRGAALRGIHYDSPIASAQVKSSILFAGLFASGETTVVEPARTRDHTERMFRALGIQIDVVQRAVTVRGPQRPGAFQLKIPGDISSASFLLAGAVLTDGEVLVRDVGLNPTRLGFLRVLERMGATVEVSGTHERLGEPVGDVSVCGAVRCSVEIGAEEVPLLIDELPLVALLATQAGGTTVVRDAAELRVKETDRITALVRSLGALGANIVELADGFAVTGPTKLRGTGLHCWGDHRIAMTLALAGTIARGETKVEGAEASAVSFPGFDRALTALGGAVVSE